jgi:hypothetical protein
MTAAEGSDVSDWPDAGWRFGGFVPATLGVAILSGPAAGPVVPAAVADIADAAAWLITAPVCPPAVAVAGAFSVGGSSGGAGAVACWLETVAFDGTAAAGASAPIAVFRVETPLAAPFAAGFGPGLPPPARIWAASAAANAATAVAAGARCVTAAGARCVTAAGALCVTAAEVPCVTAVGARCVTAVGAP